jgi:hypothetical protein
MVELILSGRVNRDVATMVRVETSNERDVVLYRDRTGLITMVAEKGC